MVTRNKRLRKRLRKTLRKKKQKGGFDLFRRNNSKTTHKDTQSSKEDPYTSNPFTRAYRYFMKPRIKESLSTPRSSRALVHAYSSKYRHHDDF